MGIGVKRIHIGKEIELRRQQLGISKSELGRRIRVPQQHINRILEKSSIDTDKLIDISVALDFNFFDLYASDKHSISAYLAAVSLQGDANNAIGDAEVAGQLSKEKAITEEKEKNIQILKERIKTLEESLDDKKAIISLLNEKIVMMTKKVVE